MRATIPTVCVIIRTGRQWKSIFTNMRQECMNLSECIFLNSFLEFHDMHVALLLYLPERILLYAFDYWR